MGRMDGVSDEVYPPLPEPSITGSSHQLQTLTALDSFFATMGAYQDQDVKFLQIMRIY